MSTDDKTLQPSEELNNEEDEDTADDTDVDNADDSQDDSSDEEESVTIPKSEYSTLTKKAEDGENYKKGLLAERRRQKEDKSDDKEDTASPDVMKRSDFEKINESKAIKMVTTIGDEDPLSAEKEEISENWDAIVGYYQNRSGRNTPEDIVEDILDAHAAWKRRNHRTASEDKEATATLSQTRGTQGQKTNPSQKTEKKSILGKQTHPSEWYS